MGSETSHVHRRRHDPLDTDRRDHLLGRAVSHTHETQGEFSIDHELSAARKKELRVSGQLVEFQAKQWICEMSRRLNVAAKQ